MLFKKMLFFNAQPCTVIESSVSLMFGMKTFTSAWVCVHDILTKGNRDQIKVWRNIISKDIWSVHTDILFPLLMTFIIPI